MEAFLLHYSFWTLLFKNLQQKNLERILHDFMFFQVIFFQKMRENYVYFEYFGYFILANLFKHSSSQKTEKVTFEHFINFFRIFWSLKIWILISSILVDKSWSFFCEFDGEKQLAHNLIKNYEKNIFINYFHVFWVFLQNVIKKIKKNVSKFKPRKMSWSP